MSNEVLIDLMSDEIKTYKKALVEILNLPDTNQRYPGDYSDIAKKALQHYNKEI